ncbi:type II secretion system F family protein [Pedococcus sp. 5OH_020]|uniref:type II secretion system F family protein n=1 Tax=Pedococcus sp. 5OH_020 TaxID=2989814 RepID=UPI0022E9C04A|nr:type II secretion system F family protein [Pedococcus sp. 5OH_020]
MSRKLRDPRLGRAPAVLAVLLCVLGALTGVLLTPVTAGASQPPVEATLSAVRATKGSVTGVLTVREGGSPVEVSADTVRSSVGAVASPITVSSVNRTKRATMLVVDTSGSMGAQGMATVRQSVKAFLADAPKDVAVGLISFAGTAGVDVAPTANRSKIQAAVNGLVARGETTLYDAVALAGPAMAGYQDRSVVLLSDGGDTRSATATRASATASLTRYSVRAEVVGFNTADSDNAVLQGFAKAGGGSVAAAGNEAAVKAAFEDAAKTLDAQSSFTITTDGSKVGVQTVVVTGTAGGAPFTARATVDLGASAAPVPTPSSSTPANVASDEPAASDPLAAPKGLNPVVLVAMGAVALGLLLLVAALAAPSFRSARSQRVSSIERYVTPGVTMSTDTAAVTASSISSSLIDVGERIMEGRESTGKTMALIERADLPLRAGEWWVLRLVALVLGVTGGVVLFSGGVVKTIFALVLGTIVGWLLPAVVLRFLAKRRAKKFESQLPDVLTLVASSLSTGFSLLQALDAVAKDAADPAAKEFSRALAETRIGADVGDALDHMSGRMQSDNMKWTGMAIRIQREVGGNLAETLRTTAKTLREREELARHVRALSAEGRLSAYILIALPIGIFFYTMKTNHDYVQLLWTRPLGLAMLAGGIISLGLGMAWMRKVVDVKV